MYHCQKNQISAILLMHTDWTITERFITIQYITIICNMCRSEILIKLKISSSNYFFTGELPLLFLVNFVKTSYLTYFWPLEESPISTFLKKSNEYRILSLTTLLSVAGTMFTSKRQLSRLKYCFSVPWINTNAVG